ncbi:MAG TPA: aminoglycoside phosphotransferase family protein [Pyrinomonadaceae bacterium]
MTEADFNQGLPAELVKHVTAMAGDVGTMWLDGLPRTISQLESEWLITLGNVFPAGEFNFVAAAVSIDGEPLVVKIAPPFDTNEIRGEAEYLRIRNGRGAVRLLAENVEQRAILIERAFPGENLSEHFAGRESDSIAPAIGVLHAVLGTAPPASDQVITLDDWFNGLHRYEESGFAPDYAAKALRIYDRLSAQPRRTYYLHADFHPGNIVTASRAPYLAIDPKGIVGHIGYEIAVFLNNFHWWQETKTDVQTRLKTAVEQFSDAFDISPHELREWAYAQMVLGAWWSFDEMPQYYDNAVAKADIWNV